MLQEQEKSCALRHNQRLGEKWNYSRPTYRSAQHQRPHVRTGPNAEVRV